MPIVARELWQAVMEAGAPYNVRPTGPSDIRRIEGAIFNWGADMTYNNNPLEMGLERLIDWDLPDSAAISLPALRRIKAKGVHRRIVGVEIDGEPFPALNFNKWPAHAAGVAGDEPIGKVTSAIYSPRLQAEHRLLLGARGAGRRRHEIARRRPNGATERRPSCRCPSSIRASASRSPSPG